VANRAHHREKRDRATENELKFRLTGPEDHARLASALRKLGAMREGAYDEENFRFEGPGKATRQVTLRLRVFGGGPAAVLTAKGPARFQNGVKIREETEVPVADSRAMLDILTLLGFRTFVVYRKHRVHWALRDVIVTLDRLDYGYFVEVEGPLDEIPGVARSLGLDPSRAVRDSYSVLARKHLTSSKKQARRHAQAAAAAAGRRPAGN
jgi:predicted adenylyl cyclase CyaB